MPEKKVLPERPVIIALLVLILLGGVAVVVYGMLGGQIGQPPQPAGAGLQWHALDQAAWMVAAVFA